MTRFVSLLTIAPFIILVHAPVATAAGKPMLGAGELFTDIGAALTPIYDGDAIWGDFDNDGDLDIVLSGTGPSGPRTRTFRNDGGGTFTFVSELPASPESALDWGDFDNDGDLDFALVGGMTDCGLTVGAFLNDPPGTFGNIRPIQARFADVAFGDVDNDGDLDIAYAGFNCFGWTGWVLENIINEGGTFTGGPPLNGAMYSAVAWGDYDNDRDLDLFVSGRNSSGESSSILYGNAGGVLANVNAPIHPVKNSTALWSDLDCDGDLDLLQTGMRDVIGPLVGELYRNDGGTLTPASVPLTPVVEGSLAAGDFDNDGWPDVFSTGSASTIGGSPTSELLRNQGDGTFTNLGAVTVEVFASSAAWGDYDNDGDLDLLVTGADGVASHARIYRNESATANVLPDPPTGLLVTAIADGALFWWAAGADAETPVAGLTYNLRVGTTPGGNQIMSAMAAPNGHRRIARMGNANHNLGWRLVLPPGTYYWSVQTIDAGFAGSPFAPEQSFSVPVVGVESGPGALAVTLRGAQPNPFAGRTSIEFELPRTGSVTLRIHDVGGRLIRTLSAGVTWPAGRHQLAWDGLTEDGRPAANGVYMASVEANGARDWRSIVRLR